MFVLALAASLDCFNYDKRYAGNSTLGTIAVSSTSDCQSACLSSPGCDFFQYDTALQVCSFQSLSQVTTMSSYFFLISGPPTCVMYQGKSKHILCFFSHYLLMQQDLLNVQIIFQAVSVITIILLIF